MVVHRVELGVEERHHRIAHKLVNNALILVQGIGRHGKIAVDDPNQILGVELFAEGAKTAHIGEEDG